MIATVTDDGQPAGSRLTLRWTTVSGPGAVTFADPATAQTTATFSTDGAYVVRMTASDGTLSASAERAITVHPKPNAAPTAQPSAVTTNEDSPAAITLSGSDPDGDALTFAVSVPPAYGTMSGAPPALTYMPAANYSGADRLEFTVSDGRAVSAPAAIAITVAPVNDPPVAVSDQAVTSEDEAVEVAVLGNDTDPEGQPLTVVSAQGGTLGQATVIGGSRLRYMPQPNRFGVDTVTYRMQDAGGAQATGQVTVTIAAVNDPPTPVLVVTPTSGEAPLAVQVDARSSSDPDQDVLSATWDFGDGSTGDGLTASHTFTNVGTFTVTLRMTDAAGATATATATVTVAGPRVVTTDWEAETAILTAPMVRTADARASGGEFVVTSVLHSGKAQWAVAVPVEGDYLLWTRLMSPNSSSDSFYVSVDGGPEDVFDTAEQAWSSAWQWRRVVGRGGTGTPETLNPRIFRLTAGVHFITFRGRDKDTLLDRLVLTNQAGLIISDATHPPTLSSGTNAAPLVQAGGDQTITLPAEATLSGTVSDDGLPFGATLTAAWSRMSGPGAVTFASSASAQTTATFSIAGTYVLRLTASDGALSASDDMQVVVKAAAPVNKAPVVNAGADQTITLPGTAGLSGTVTDDGLPTGASITSAWSSVSGPGTVTFASSSTKQTSAMFSVAGTYVLRLSANDTLLSGKDEVQITVQPRRNAAPIPQSKAVTTAEETALPIRLVGTDADGDPLTYTITTLPAHGTVTGDAPALVYMPSANYSGADRFEFTVSDDLATSVPAAIAITVTPVNDLPVAAFSVSPTEGAIPLAIQTDASASADVEGPLTYAWSFGDGGSGSGVLASHTFTTAGTFTVTLTVTDNAGAVATATARVTSRDATPPQIRDLRVERTPSRELAVTWLTDEPATSTLTYWHEDDQVRHVVPGSATPITTHRLIADQPKRRAWFIVTVRDAAGNALSSPERRLADDNDLR